MPGYFIALVAIGNKEQAETELLLPSMSGYTQDLYGSLVSPGGRRMMLEVRNQSVLDDVKALMQIRKKPTVPSVREK